jgi:transcriptional regulator with XRE-family HTH domain
MKLGEYLKQIRDERAPTQEEFVKWLKTFMKVSTSTYSLWERDVSTPNFIQMCKIAKKIGVSLDSIAEQIRNDYRCAAVLDTWEQQEPVEIDAIEVEEDEETQIKPTGKPEPK